MYVKWRCNEKTTEAQSRPQPKSLILMSGAGGCLEIIQLSTCSICFGLTVLICVRGLETDCVVVGGEAQDGVGGLVR